MLGRMGWRFPSALAIVFALVAPASASAACTGVQGNLVANCSFEEPALGAGSETRVDPGRTIGAWTVSTGGDAVDLVTKGFAGGYPVADGNQSVDLNRDNPGAVEQRLATTGGVAYRVTLQVSGFPAARSGCTGTEPMRLRVTVAGVTREFSFQPDDLANPAGNQRFEQHEFEFVAGGSDLFKLAGLNSGCTGPVVDDVVVAAVGPAPQPALGRAMTAAVVSGAVLVQPPGSRSFTPLTTVETLPVGTLVDARGGRVRITATSGGKTYSADFYGGIFQIAQLAKKGATADMKLFGGSFRGCPRAPRAAKKPKAVRQLWGSGSGPFRTVGRFSAATVRGTTWLTQDQCRGTLTRVTAGAVTVRDFARRKSIVVRAGKRYFARAAG